MSDKLNNKVAIITCGDNGFGRALARNLALKNIRVNDIAPAVVFLASDDSSYMIGQVMG